MIIFQVALIIFFALAAAGAFLRHKRNEITASRAAGWIFFWILAAVAIILPGAPDYLAHAVGIGRGADLVSYVSLTVLFYLVFSLYVRLNKIEKQITKVVRDEALREKGE